MVLRWRELTGPGELVQHVALSPTFAVGIPVLEVPTGSASLKREEAAWLRSVVRWRCIAGR